MCSRAFKILKEKLPQATQCGTASCIGEIDSYKIWLGFKKGISTWKCSCTQSIYAQSHNPCVHSVALSVAWGRNRGVPDPTAKDITFLTKKR